MLRMFHTPRNYHKQRTAAVSRTVKMQTARGRGKIHEAHGPPHTGPSEQFNDLNGRNFHAAKVPPCLNAVKYRNPKALIGYCLHLEAHIEAH